MATVFLPFFLVICISFSLLLIVSGHEETVQGAQHLTAEDYDEATQDSDWIIMFFAPWCGHCRELEPTWNAFADRIHHSDINVNVGMLDCTSASKQCSKVGVKGYPSIKHVRGDFFLTYRGPRSVPFFEAFAKRISEDPVSRIYTITELERLKKENEVMFVYVGADVVAEQKQDNSPLSVFQEEAHRLLLESVYFMADLSAVKGEEFKNEGLYVLKDDAVISYGGAFENEALNSWIMQEKFPKFFELTRDNAVLFREQRPGTLLVIGVVDTSLNYKPYLQSLKEISKDFVPRYKSDVHQFVWLDGRKWEAFAVSLLGISLHHMPTVAVFNHDTMDYYSYSGFVESELKKNPSRNIGGPTTVVNRVVLEDFIGNISAGAVPSHGGKGFIGRLETFLLRIIDVVMLAGHSVYVEYPQLMYLTVLSVSLLIIGCFRNVVRSSSTQSGIARADPVATKKIN